MPGFTEVRFALRRGWAIEEGAPVLAGRKYVIRSDVMRLLFASRRMFLVRFATVPVQILGDIVSYGICLVLGGLMRLPWSPAHTRLHQSTRPIRR